MKSFFFWLISVKKNEIILDIGLANDREYILIVYLPRTKFMSGSGFSSNLYC